MVGGLFDKGKGDSTSTGGVAVLFGNSGMFGQRIWNQTLIYQFFGVLCGPPVEQVPSCDHQGLQ